MLRRFALWILGITSITDGSPACSNFNQCGTQYGCTRHSNCKPLGGPVTNPTT